MANEHIKFGTDGWRGLIADDYTFENVRRVGGAIASYILKNEDASRGVVVGYDTRFASRAFAEAMSEVLAEAGIPVRLSSDYITTPAISYTVKRHGCAGGVMITSSHNPWQWNGVKFKAKYGGSGSPAIMKAIEAELYSNQMPRGKKAALEIADFKPDYIAAISRFADLDAIARANFRFAIDCMYGAGRNILSGIFAEHGIRHVQIRAEVNPLFPGINPEPIEPHVRLLQETAVKEKCDAGLVTDGDADRVGAVTENGEFVDAHKCFAIILKWLLEHKRWPGAITRAFNTTRMLDRIARKYGRELIEHGIGFKYVCDVVLSGKEVLIGGEESGGIGIPRHLPERDGILNSLLLANAMADYKKPLGQLVADLQQEFGAHYYGRRDLHVDRAFIDAALRRASSGNLTRIGRYKIVRTENLDGIKFFLDAPNDGNGAEAWILMRGSGTEPLMRLYCEAASPALVNEILEAGLAFVHQKSTVA
jgi:phosphomannomutase